MKILTKLLIALALLIPLSAPALAYNPLGGACAVKAKDTTPTTCSANTKYQSPNANSPVNHVVQDAANVVALAAGLAAVIIIIISGLTMVISGGDEEKIKKARAMLMNAIIGLVIVAAAWTIVTFVVQKLVS